MATVRSQPAGGGILAPLALSALLAGCSQAPPPATPKTGPEATSVLEPMPTTADDEGARPVEESAPDEAVTERKEESSEPETSTGAQREDATVIAVAKPEPKPKPRTLWEAAVAARAKRADAPQARISVTDENLHEFQDAELTFAEPGPRSGSGTAAGEGEDEGTATAKSELRGEEYWRSRVRALRLRLRSMVDELAELDERAAGLRRSFYAADDPYVRDAEIKPAWDRALDRIGALRRELTVVARELADTLEEGRQAGALPGWLREAIELEPTPEELAPSEGRTHEPGEPDVVEIEEPPPAP